MGCASSSPLMESGKNLVDNAKDQAGDVVSKGEQTLHDVGDKISTEVDHMKDAMKSALDTAENSIGSVMGKVSNNVDHTTSDMNAAVNNMEEEAEEAVNAVSDSATEAVSEAETVLASEAENAKEMVSSKTSEVFEKIDSTKEVMQEKANEMKETVEDTLHIEDMEQTTDMLGDSVDNVEKKVEEIVTKLPTPATSPAKESQKEEPPPTSWEAAADAILEHKPSRASMDICDIEVDKEISPTDNTIIEINREDTPELDEDLSEKMNNELLSHDSIIEINEKRC